MKKRQYSDRDKASALAALDLNEGNVSRTSKQIGIPRKTLEQWAAHRHLSADVADLRQEKKAELSVIIEDAVREMIGASSAKLEGANFQQLWTSIGIGIDKRQILQGEPTSINKDVTEHSNEERANRILELVKPAKAA